MKITTRQIGFILLAVAIVWTLIDLFFIEGWTVLLKTPIYIGAFFLGKFLGERF